MGLLSKRGLVGSDGHGAATVPLHRPAAQAVMPPSQTSTDPVVKLDASLAR